MFHRLNVVEEHPTYEEAVEIFLNTVRTCYHGLVSSAGHLWFPDEKNGEKMVVEVEEAKQGQQQQGQQQQGQQQQGQQQGQSLSSPEQKKWLHDMIYVHIPQKLEEVETSLLSSDGAGRKGLVVFGHNDLQPGNILIKANVRDDDDHDDQIVNQEENQENQEEEEEVQVTFIDFEYARSVPRGYDIANYWCEWAADYHGPTPHLMNYAKFPNEKKRREFGRSYLGVDATEEEITLLVDEAMHFVQLSHLWWGVWSLTQATQSTIDFDYIGYGKCRLDQLEEMRR